MKVSDQMVKYPLITDKNMSVEKALAFMNDCGIRHLPVLENSELVGVVSDRDLRYAIGMPEVKQLCVEDVMTPDPYAVRAETPLAEVARTMAQEKMGSAIIVNHHYQVIGIFTTTDAVRVLSELLESQPQKQFNMISIEEYIPARVM